MSNAPPITTRETVESLARKCVADSLAERGLVKKPQKHCTCIKCAEITCSSSQTVEIHAKIAEKQ